MWHQKLKGTQQKKCCGCGRIRLRFCILFDKKMRVLLFVYVDNVLIAGRAEHVRRFKKQVMNHFDVWDMEEASVFLGMIIRRDRVSRTLHLS